MNIFSKFQFKVTLILILSMVLVLLLSNLIILKFTLDSSFKSIRENLMMIAQTAALYIDAERLDRIPLNEAGMGVRDFKIVQEKLINIKKVNPKIKYIYTMKKTEKVGLWKFVVDAEPYDPDSDLTSFPGQDYDASRFSEMMKAFDGPAADTKLEVDEWGATLSGYAPVRNKDGVAIAMVGVDVMADDIYAMQRERQYRCFLVVFLWIFISIFFGHVFAKKITGPILHLTSATRYVGRGNFTYRVKVEGNDEIAELAQAFNQMSRSLFKSRRRLVTYFQNTVRSLVKVLESRDQYTKGHSHAVAKYAMKIALKMGLPKDDVKLFKKMIILHDIGKTVVKDNILNKQGPLTPEEWEDIKQHPKLGEAIVHPVVGSEEMLSVIGQHHERYDGKGYPKQLKGDQINIYAAITSIADAYHAMISDRPYRKALAKDVAMEELRKGRGTQFNPHIVDVFLKILAEEKK